MHKVASHRNLIVWQKSMDMVVHIYELADCFPKMGLYRLTSQITRSAASVLANVVEGNARTTAKEYAHFLSIAKGSIIETETFLMLAIRLEYLQQADAVAALNFVTEISKMLTTLRYRLVTERGS
jgi:four helix bundle protein